MFLHMVWVLHVAWAVNSASHIWGYRNYPTQDDSRNLWWVGLLANGEGWHTPLRQRRRPDEKGIETCACVFCPTS